MPPKKVQPKSAKSKAAVGATGRRTSKANVLPPIKDVKPAAVVPEETGARFTNS
jgi:hypothetical protein